MDYWVRTKGQKLEVNLQHKGCIQIRKMLIKLTSFASEGGRKRVLLALRQE